MLFRYLKGAGISLFVGIVLFLFADKIHIEYIELHLLFVTLYNYIFCLLGLAVFFVLKKMKIESKHFINVVIYILLGAVSSLSFPPLYFIFISGSVVFYLTQQIQNRKLSIALTFSGPLLFIVLLLVF